jgi:hypothetical protein
MTKAFPIDATEAEKILGEKIEPKTEEKPEGRDYENTDK